MIFGCFGRRSLRKRVAFGLQQLHLLFRFQIISFGADIGKGHTFVFIRLRSRRGVRVRFALGAIEILIEIEQIEQIVFGFERGVLLIQPNEISGGAVPLFLNEADVVLLLELEHLVFGVAQIFFGLDQLFGDAGGDRCDPGPRACPFLKSRYFCMTAFR